jgi:ribA/ribD-fused uncharacterized protein
MTTDTSNMTTTAKSGGQSLKRKRSDDSELSSCKDHNADASANLCSAQTQHHSESKCIKEQDNKQQQTSDQTPIWFYAADKPYGQFSNFWTSTDFKLEIDGVSYKSSESCYQALKYLPANEDTLAHREYRDVIANAKTPAQTFFLGRQKAPTQWEWARKLQHEVIDRYKFLGVAPRPDWDAVKDGIMEMIVRAKFLQNPTLLQFLLSTGDRDLVEHTSRDSYWADGGNGSGLNKLGVILMKLRTEFRAQTI